MGGKRRQSLICDPTINYEWPHVAPPYVPPPRSQVWNPNIDPSNGVQARLPTLEVFLARNPRFLMVEGRSLTRREIKLARTVFGESIDYRRVRIGLAVGVANSPTTLGNVIRLSHQTYNNGMNDSIFIHEMTHVWQYQTRGMGYASNSFEHQVGAWVCSFLSLDFTNPTEPAYTITAQEIQKAGSIYALSAERQARVLEMWQLNGEFEVEMRVPHETKREAMRDGPKVLPVRELEAAQHMIKQVQAARPLPVDHVLEEAAWGASMLQQRLTPEDPHRPDSPPILRVEF